MDNRDLLHQWHHSSHRAQEVNADHQEIEETDEELDIRWRLKHPNNEGDHLPRWTENIKSHQEDLHPGITMDEGVHRQEETEGQARAVDPI
eukprot:515944-Amphidinium_carterae.1